METILFDPHYSTIESIQPRTPSLNINHPDLEGLQVDTLRKTRFFDTIDEKNVKFDPNKKLPKDIYRKIERFRTNSTLLTTIETIIINIYNYKINRGSRN